MRSYARRLWAVVCAVAAILLGSDALMNILSLFGDVRDPSRPGHLKGESVSLPAELAKVVLALALLAVTTRLWRHERGSDDLPF